MCCAHCSASVLLLGMCDTHPDKELGVDGIFFWAADGILSIVCSGGLLLSSLCAPILSAVVPVITPVLFNPSEQDKEMKDCSSLRGDSRCGIPAGTPDNQRRSGLGEQMGDKHALFAHPLVHACTGSS